MAAIFERQWIHALAIAVMLPILYQISLWCTCFHRGEMWGISTWNWFWISVEIPILHQIYVWFCWRTELHKGLISRIFGRLAFPLYAAIFTFFMVARLATVTILAIASRETIALNNAIFQVLAVLVAIPVAYLMYSVARFFGLLRAYGADHFDHSYRSKQLVRKGIFRHTSNGMYIFGMMALYIPGLWFASRPALVAAAFSHLYIWIHFWTTEKPDMERIYGSSGDSR